MLTGCLGRLIADKSMSDEDFKECGALVGPIRARLELVDFRIPPGITDFIEGRTVPFADIYPVEQPRSILCHTEVRGLLLRLWTVVDVWRVLDQSQAAIVEAIRVERRRLAQAKPTLVRFREREVWLVYGNVGGSGFKRGEERVLRTVVIR
jgi:hypothetical protein